MSGRLCFDLPLQRRAGGRQPRTFPGRIRRQQPGGSDRLDRCGRSDRHYLCGRRTAVTVVAVVITVLAVTAVTVAIVAAE